MSGRARLVLIRYRDSERRTIMSKMTEGVGENEGARTISEHQDWGERGVVVRGQLIARGACVSVCFVYCSPQSQGIPVIEVHTRCVFRVAHRERVRGRADSAPTSSPTLQRSSPSILIVLETLSVRRIGYR